MLWLVAWGGNERKSIQAKTRGTSSPSPYPLWSRTAKNTDCSTGPLARPLAHSLAPLTHLLALDCSLRPRPPLRSLVRSLSHFAHSLTLLTPSLVGKCIIRWLFCLCFFPFSTVVLSRERTNI